MNFLQMFKFIPSFKKLVLFGFMFLAFYPSITNAQKQYTIVLDAGHGGKDPEIEVMAIMKNTSL